VAETSETGFQTAGHRTVARHQPHERGQIAALPPAVEVGLGGAQAAAGQQLAPETRIEDLEVGRETVGRGLAEQCDGSGFAQGELPAGELVQTADDQPARHTGRGAGLSGGLSGCE